MAKRTPMDLYNSMKVGETKNAKTSEGMITIKKNKPIDQQVSVFSGSGVPKRRAKVIVDQGFERYTQGKRID